MPDWVVAAFKHYVRIHQDVGNQTLVVHVQLDIQHVILITSIVDNFQNVQNLDSFSVNHNESCFLELKNG